jgi:hypothetical protein
MGVYQLSYISGELAVSRSGRALGEPGRESTVGGRESAQRLQRVLLLRLCQGAETPEEATGIWGAVDKYMCHGRYAAECNMITNKQTIVW